MVADLSLLVVMISVMVQGFATRSGGDAANKRQYQGKGSFASGQPDFCGRCGFFAAGARIEIRCQEFRFRQKDIPLCPSPFT
jgi:hypothetical protein